MTRRIRGLACLQLLLLIVAPALAQDVGVPQDMPLTPLGIETELGRYDFRVQIADETAERNKGLMFRRDMPADEGMLFIFPMPEAASFWMKNTYIPLDLIFIRANGRIANIEQGAPHDLSSIRSRGRVLAVLELNAGTAERLGIGAGDTVRHRALGNWPCEAAAGSDPDK